LAFNVGGPELVVDQSVGDKTQPRVAGGTSDGGYLITYVDGGVPGGQAGFVEYDSFGRLRTSNLVAASRCSAGVQSQLDQASGFW
jgi:hypothetical protein